jgi:adenylate cyclase
MVYEPTRDKLLSPARDFNSIQERVRQTLDKGVQIDLSTELCKRFLRRHVNCKIGVVILYVDIDGSTRMSMAITPAEFATILHVFSQEMSLIISEYGGYTLKYVGDAVIALFPAGYDRHQPSRNAVGCANDMHEIIKKCINPELAAHGLPEIRIKISIDYGDVQVVLYGKSLERSHIDIVGSSISMAAKMIAVARTGQIVAGQSLYENLADNQGFARLDVDPARWSYVDEKSGSSYRLYLMK